ncbi:Thymidine kinase, cytosolic [Microtus ochrogaster]|uniref:Thymidine kinase n=1 Tax=Microtus ochrogaster TaxID=79684 RepID=A0A8J6KU27_MICOH|nr:Thymidine kinase, cytosolic [Microtus ochrogaster]
MCPPCCLSPPARPGGQIQVILRPTFSGKSTELMRRVWCFQIAQNKYLVIKYAKDTSYSSSFCTHDWNTMDALPACLLWDVAQEALGVAVIGIDKGQFSPDIVEFCELVANGGKTLIVAALYGTFQRKAFCSILNLVPLADSVVKLTAVCMECFREAAYTKRLVMEKEAEVIGGADKYHSVCCLCYFKKSPDNKENFLMLGEPGEASAVRKLFAPHQSLEHKSANSEDLGLELSHKRHCPGQAEMLQPSAEPSPAWSLGLDIQPEVKTEPHGFCDIGGAGFFLLGGFHC